MLQGNGLATVFDCSNYFPSDIPFNHDTYVTDNRQLTDRQTTDINLCHRHDR